MLLVGLTGGIGAGKSLVATWLAEHGAMVVNADAVAREVVAPGTPGLASVLDAFGPAVLDSAGGLDRVRLGQLVFRDDRARARLEAIVHPLVRSRTAELIAGAPRDAVVVNEVPLLVEAGLAESYDLVIVVTAAEEIRVRRLVESRGLSPAEALARIRAQADDGQRLAVADVVIDNSGPLEDLRRQVDAVWQSRLAGGGRRN